MKKIIAIASLFLAFSFHVNAQETSKVKSAKTETKIVLFSCLVDSVSSILFSNKKSSKRRLMLWVISFYLSDIKVKFVQEIRLGNHT